MAFVLRFVQEYRVADRDTFMDLEARFAEMERRHEDWPIGRRLQPYAGDLPTPRRPSPGSRAIANTRTCSVSRPRRS